MGFVKSFEELAGPAQLPEFYDAEMLTVMWETKPEIIERLLPPPLKPPAAALAFAFVAYYPRTNFGPPYHEGALFLMAEFNGEAGSYCLSMPVTRDMAMAGGREKYGYPKKLADIRFDRNGDVVTGQLERHGVAYFQVKAELGGKPTDETFQHLFAERFNKEDGAVSYLFKHFLAPDGSGFDYHPRLVRQPNVLRPHTIEWGEAEVILRPSDPDPWHEVEVVKMLGAVYTIGNNTMLNGSVVAEVNPMEFMPYAFSKWDW